ncbi:MAG TPA: hypothetical protein VEH31_31775 [Streptosporangiaceae bacterium]|nr:hypothetical protein [Streptosporangiaceae bacterium]
MSAVGLHELQVMRWLLDTCDSAAQARQALLAVKHYYFMVPATTSSPTAPAIRSSMRTPPAATCSM